jgi:SNF family Na+-dependent transporter
MKGIDMAVGTSDRGQWKTRWGFILAAAGSAVGLGNIWKFPYITGENGGGLFVLIYLICIALVGIPIMMAEIMIGRAAQKQPVVAFHTLAGKQTPWAGVGWLGVLAGFVILSYYIVVAGWAMDFTLKSVANFTEPIHDNAELVATNYRATASPEEMRLRLVDREYERDLREPLRQLQARVKPSDWDGYERYTAALAAAGARDLKRAEILHDVYTENGIMIDADADLQLLLSPSDRILIDEWQDLAQGGTTDAERAMQGAYDETRRRLVEDPEIMEHVEASEEILLDIEKLRRETRLAAMDKYPLPPDPEDGDADAIEARLDAERFIRDEATTLVRRTEIFDSVNTAFGQVATDGWTSVFWAALFMLITILIVASGVGAGIERACRLLMPMLFVLILVMVVYGSFKSGFSDAVSFVFKPDPHKLKASGVLEALGHAFFTLSLGMGAMITYGSYQKSKERLAGQSFTIAILDTGIALLACLMIFPITFSYGQDPDAGPGLVFKSMPLAFAEIGKGGMLLAIMFFGLVVFAALTSAISLLEVVASYFIDQWNWNRKRAAWIFGGVIFLFGIPSAFSMDPNFAMPGWAPSFGKNFFDTMDYLASNWMLPMGGLLIAIYAGWFMPRKMRDAELQGMPSLLVGGWFVLIRFIAPVLVIIVLAQKVGILDADEVLHGLFN